MTDRLELQCPAKLNLFLHITGRREDGYHCLQTIFQIIDLCDTLVLNKTSSPELHFDCDDASLNTDDNLVLRAAKALQLATGTSLGATMHLSKHIPTGAGLGGGSSNAASTLLGLNRLWNTQLSPEQLARIGLSLGADVPLFVLGRTAWAEGIGEKLTPMTLSEKTYLVIDPGCHVSTQEIFSHQQLTRNTTAIKMAAFLARDTRNDCENVVRSLYPPVDNALIWLGQYAEARMTGTGASIFATFDCAEDAHALLLKIPKGMRGFVAKGLNSSPAC